MVSSNPNAAPIDYTSPPFPSLYWPFKIKAGDANYLYYSSDIWRFTLLWTLIIYGTFHGAASGYAVIVQAKNWKIIWVVPILYAVVAGIEGVLAGSVVGLM
ncbi:MAG: hypothetical protein M1827_002655 [Pycnora praestabilis]|nr:MAG: hypothetical protein M1827_002655 [Pycnora praestabilis]